MIRGRLSHLTIVDAGGDGGVCPMQFFGLTADGRDIYVRYRSGILSVGVGLTHQHERLSPDWYWRYAVQVILRWLRSRRQFDNTGRQLFERRDLHSRTDFLSPGFDHVHFG